MSRRTWNVFISFVILFILSGLVVSAIQSYTSFKKLVLDEMVQPIEIRSIHIIKGMSLVDRPSIEVTDSKTIERIMDSLNDLRLKRSNKDMALGEEDTYYLRINPKKGNPFNVTFNEPNIIQIGNSLSEHKKYGWKYEVINEFDSSAIKDLFK